MHSPLSTRLTHAFNAARPARRHVARALRHHTARTRALAEQLRDTKPVDNVRVWFRTFFSALSMQGASRRFSLRTLLRNPAPVRMLGVSPRAAKPASVAHPTSRRPRRLSVTSEGWFAFAR
ncbi:hypothetical protein [Paraburkholderia hospita]|jgi:hypothetical protein|uniref:hypothetical protein n=1 Tax=Paraburkholderia TaxID=1822464 RepID=UPI000271616B|nr:hypothetical protein [Paraburkholderia hospita]EUC21542.1 hypothetical protein PMI06_009258 [Burkholderia sp. BT03]SKC66614.1 hypothetical protein SAMN05445504_0565 [Burkholderia sp. CF099]SKC95196.1 hypothetical protein SAMN06266956_6826 [Paraburkholderia hospita]